VSEFHEEFEGQAADTTSAAPTDTAEPASSPEVETADVDAPGADAGSDTAANAAGVGTDEPELAEELTSDEDAVAAGGEPGVAPAPAAEVEVEDKAAQYLALAQRTQADFENYKKRAARDAALAQQRGITKLVRELLPALDNLERAIGHAPEEDPLLEGIKLVYSDLLGALKRSGIESFDPAGESFDPNVHEAVAQFPKEGVEPGVVVEVYQQGYRLGETVLRPARVVVAA
jgi:molecular chaperone GrpE